MSRSQLADEARDWLVEHGYDDTMGARPMGRLIQSAIKTGLAEEVLFGKLKGGGNVRVVVVDGEDGKKKLGFEFPEGPVQPKPEKIPVKAKPKAKRAAPKKAAAPRAVAPKAVLPKSPSPPPLPAPKDDGGEDEPPKPRRSPVPKLPLKKL